MGLKYYLNALKSPDMSSIKNIWQIKKQGIKETDFIKIDNDYRRAIINNWEAIP